MEFDFTKQPGKKYDKKRAFDMKQPLATIVTPFYNAGKYFRQTFWSVVNQTFPWFEWLIIDDGSDREQDLALLEALAKTDNRILVIHQKNRGLAAARNTGVQKAKTDIIVPLDADDLLEPQFLEYTWFGLYFHPHAAWCYTDSVGFGQQEYVWRKPWNAKKLKKENFLVATAAIRRQAFAQTGGYQEKRHAYYEDWQFWLRLLEKRQYPVHVRGYLFWYRRLDSGMLSGIRADGRQQRLCKRMIRQAASKADPAVQAVEYPLVKSEEPYDQPTYGTFWNDYSVCPEQTRTGQNRTHPAACREQAEWHREKIRILLLVPWLVMGGADRLNLELVKGLDRNRFAVSVITTVPAEHEWHSYFARYTDEIFHLPDFLDAAHYLEYVAYYIQTRKVQVLFVSNSYRGYAMLPWLRRQFPCLCIVDYVHMEEWYWKAGGFARLSANYGAFLDRTYVCNTKTRDVLVHTLQREAQSVAVMYIGVDTRRFDPARVPRGRFYQKLKVSQARPIVLFPCRMDAQKRPFLMLAVAQKVCRQIPDVLFVAVGGGPQKAALQRAIQKRGLGGHVICIGPVRRMENCYQDAKLTLICSLKEGLSLTACESCAMGTPVVSSDVGGQSDLIDDSVGKLVPVRQKEGTDFDQRIYAEEEIADYAQAIVRLLSDQTLYQACSEACRPRVLGGFTTKNMCRQMEEELVRLTEDGVQIRRRQKLAAEMNSVGCLPEELYIMELAEEERSMLSAAAVSFLETALAKCLPPGSVWRDRAVQFYRKWRSKT